MSAVWIILLDTSSSMNKGFSGKRPTNDPLAEVGPWKSKLDAAKTLLHRQIQALPAQDIVIIQFSSTAKKIFHDGQSAYDPSSIDQIIGSGKTSIASAFDLVVSDLTIMDYDSISVLVLTDGLANEGDAAASARNFIGKYPKSRIDTILIDPTDEGDEVALAISINGFVRPAFSSLELEATVDYSRVTSLKAAVSDSYMSCLQLDYALAIATNSPPPIALPVTSAPTLTSGSLATQIVPAIASLEDLQSVACDVQREPYQGRIISISVSSLVKIKISGLGDAVAVLLNNIIPWRVGDAKRKLKLDEIKQKLDIARQWAELDRLTLETEHVKREYQRKYELQKLEDLDRLLRMERDIEQLRVARGILESFLPKQRDLSPEESDIMINRLLQIMNEIADNPIEFGNPIHPNIDKDKGENIHRRHRR